MQWFENKTCFQFEFAAPYKQHSFVKEVNHGAIDPTGVSQLTTYMFGTYTCW